ncbi:class A sortase [Periweissella cryptocerci]|uniref:Class A sortase n=1 Tax=Periweissella cryptocerci TaxID=2506420 RepID=A0A4P6YQW2_9LACO|nr:class A sortase [Periweissella cryptocerci]QBO34973.1 class A sortase [Periweissella cryptocerci]
MTIKTTRTKKRKHHKAQMGICITLITMSITTLVLAVNPVWWQGRLGQHNADRIAASSKIKHQQVKADYGLGDDIPSWSAMNKLQKVVRMETLRGYVSVPELGIELPIYEGTSNVALASGAGTPKGVNDGFLKEADVMGKSNYALSAHNMADYRTYFSPLQRNISGTSLAGFKIYVTDGRKVYQYKQTLKHIIDNTDAASEWLRNTSKTDNSPIITLTTCFEQPPYYYHATKRIIIRGDYVGEQALTGKLAKQLFEMMPPKQIESK